MIKFVKGTKIIVQVFTGLELSGNINDVMNTLHNLSYIFRNCRVSGISKQEFTDAVKVIMTIKELKTKTQSRRRL
ncbi:MAG: hypothetical protein K2N23_00300 [Clostridia bacterium]|nr:hypothetical protein [Clostridia bacterium]